MRSTVSPRSCSGPCPASAPSARCALGDSRMERPAGGGAASSGAQAAPSQPGSAAVLDGPAHSSRQRRARHSHLPRGQPQERPAGCAGPSHHPVAGRDALTEAEDYAQNGMHPPGPASSAVPRRPFPLHDVVHTRTCCADHVCINHVSVIFHRRTHDHPVVGWRLSSPLHGGTGRCQWGVVVSRRGGSALHRCCT